jgi:hypothetical protein
MGCFMERERYIYICYIRNDEGVSENGVCHQNVMKHTIFSGPPICAGYLHKFDAFEP